MQSISTSELPGTPPDATATQSELDQLHALAEQRETASQLDGLPQGLEPFDGTFQQAPRIATPAGDAIHAAESALPACLFPVVGSEPEQREQLRDQQQRDHIDRLSTMTSYSQALTLFDAGDYVSAVAKMEPVMRDAPNSIVVQLTYTEMKRRAADKAREKAKDKISGGIRSIFKKP